MTSKANYHGLSSEDSDYCACSGCEAMRADEDQAAHAFGSVDLYLGDDGLIYQS